MRDDVRRHIQTFLTGQREAQTRFLAELVRIPSDNPPGDCQPHAERTAALLDEFGLVAEKHAVPDALVKQHGMASITNLIVRHRFNAGPTIALNAHGDVVPPGLGWTTDPYGAEIRDGVMYGRGVAVSKSDFATYAFALLAVKDAAAKLGLDLGGAVELHLTYDEEAGGLCGPGYILSDGISRPDYAISAGFSYNIVTAHNGCLHLEVEIIGRSAHAAMPASGIDALEAATGVLAALYEMRSTLAKFPSATPGIGPAALTVGLIHGGINTNVVPDKITMRIDRRIIPEEQPVDVEAALRTLIEESAARYPGITTRIERILLAEPFLPMAGQAQLVESIRGHAESIFDTTIATHGVPIYTDARLYSAAGIPTVLYGAGPRTVLEANGHRADERLKLGDLFKATEVVALALVELLSPAAECAG